MVTNVLSSVKCDIIGVLYEIVLFLPFRTGIVQAIEDAQEQRRNDG